MSRACCEHSPRPQHTPRPRGHTSSCPQLLGLRRHHHTRCVQNPRTLHSSCGQPLARTRPRTGSHTPTATLHFHVLTAGRPGLAGPGCWAGVWVSVTERAEPRVRRSRNCCKDAEPLVSLKTTQQCGSPPLYLLCQPLVSTLLRARRGRL